MSINPVQGIGAAEQTRFGQPNVRPSQPQASAQEPPDPTESNQTDTGTPPKQEVHRTQKVSPAAELPQDEVRVQRDTETNGEIVIKYLDHSGNVILQVPSSQMLGVTRAIDQDFQDQAKIRENQAVTPEGSAGGKAHGH